MTHSRRNEVWMAFGRLINYVGQIDECSRLREHGAHFLKREIIMSIRKSFRIIMHSARYLSWTGASEANEIHNSI